jgi:hypothetical protein
MPSKSGSSRQVENLITRGTFSYSVTPVAYCYRLYNQNDNVYGCGRLETQHNNKQAIAPRVHWYGDTITILSIHQLILFYTVGQWAVYP